MARKLLVEIVGDSSSYERSLGRSSKATKTFQGSLASLGSTTKAFARNSALVAGAAAGLVGVLGVKAVGAASDLNEQINKTSVVFGKSSKALTAWSKTTANSLGLSQRAALEAAGGFGAMLQTAGLTGDQSADFSKKLVTLGADMASFNNISPDEALQKLKSGLAGEAEPLRTVGVLLSEARVKQEAYDLGLAKTGATLTEQQKVQARYSLILKDTAKQQGDFARTSDSLANASRRAKASLEDASATIGGALLPVVAKAASAFAQFLPTLQRSLGRISSVIGPKLQQLFDGVLPVIQNLISTVQARLPDLQRIFVSVFTPIKTFVLPVIRDVANLFIGAWSNIVRVVADNREQLTTIFSNLGTALQNIWTIAKPTIVFLFKTALPLALRVAIPLLAKVTGVTKLMSQVFVRVVSTIIKALDVFLGGLTKLADAASHLPLVGDKFAGVSDKINAGREDLRSYATALDALNGKQVNVTVTTTFDSKGNVVPSGEHAPTGKGPRTTTSRTTTTTPPPDVETPVERRERHRLEAQDRRRRQQEARESARQAAVDAAAALKQRNEAIRAATKAAQFERLGLTGTGEKRTPGAGALRKVAGNLLDQIKGTTLDTAKTRRTLARIRRVLSGEFGKVGQDVRQAILQMLNDIKSALSDGGETLKGPLTKTHGLNTKKIIEGLGLSPEEAQSIRGRLSGFNTAGRELAAAGSRAQPGRFVDDRPIVLHANLYVDGKRMANNTTRHQQQDRSRNPRQKRGRHRN